MNTVRAVADANELGLPCDCAQQRLLERAKLQRVRAGAWNLEGKWNGDHLLEKPNNNDPHHWLLGSTKSHQPPPGAI